jgi:hypothetical protein
MLSFEAVLTFFVLHATGARGIGAGDGAAFFVFRILRRIACLTGIAQVAFQADISLTEWFRNLFP